MKKSLCILIIVMALLGVVSCKTPSTESPAPTVIPTQQPITEPALQPLANDSQITNVATAEESQIANATTSEELRGLVEQFRSGKNYNALYLAAVKLVEIDPEYAPGYTDAAWALLELSKSNYDEINRLLEQGCKNAADNAEYISEWVMQNEPNLLMKLPFISDLTSVDEINTVGITSGNSFNKIKINNIWQGWQGGLLTSQGEWVYFSSQNENFALYKMRSNGENIERLGEDSGSFLNIIGDWLYFCNLSDDGKLYKMRTDGSEKTKITDDSCEFISVADGWIYYCNTIEDGCLFKVRTDGSDRIQLNDTVVMTPYVSDGWVYYYAKKEGGFWRVSTDGSTQQLLSEQSVISYCLSDGWIYYLTDNSGMVIEKMLPDGSEISSVYAYDAKITSFNIYGNRIYISVRDNEGRDKIISFNMDTSLEEQEFYQVSEILCTSDGDWLYYADWNDGNIWYRINIGSGETEKLR